MGDNTLADTQQVHSTLPRRLAAQGEEDDRSKQIQKEKEEWLAKEVRQADGAVHRTGVISLVGVVFFSKSGAGQPAGCR